MARKANLESRADLLQGTLDMLIRPTLLSGPQHGHAAGRSRGLRLESCAQA
jgi:hypothetical protein